MDFEVFLLNNNGKVNYDDDFIFYNNLKHYSGCVEHLGDCINYDAYYDDCDEQISVDLSKVPTNIQEIVFALTIHEAERKYQNFGCVSHIFLCVMDSSGRKGFVKHNFPHDYTVETAIILGKFCRKDSGWKFTFSGSGYSGGLIGLCKHFGVNV